VTSGDGEARRPRVVLGVSGGIAAYKVCSVLRSLTESGCAVRVVPTASALRFVGAPTWEALSGQPVTAEVWDDVAGVPHVRLGQEADLLLVAPATADLLARAASGRADDLLTSVLLTARCPVLMAPAMHTEMWRHPATRANVETLRGRGVVVLEPASGRLTGEDRGPGRLPEPAQIVTAARRLLARGRTARPDLAGRQVVVSAGGTREPLDPVRFLGNRSSGRQGFALAATAAARGAQVTLVAANVELPVPAGVELIPVGTALDLRDAVLKVAEGVDVVVMAAAVADFRPAQAAEHKIKKADDPDEAPVVRLVRNPDVLVELVGRRTEGQVVVGFAAETGDDSGDVLGHARRKLERKRCDLLAVNDVSEGRVFGRPDTHITLLNRDGGAIMVPGGTKEEVADAIWDVIAGLLPGSDPVAGSSVQ
jgi:phosphopantothenoylcysteine decarboxylase/phosphopantothenate--cysteine ligase